MRNEDESEVLSVIEGRNALAEALAAEKSIDKLFYLESARESGSLPKLIAQCRDAGAQLIPCDRKKLDSMSQTGAHQGVIAQLSGVRYAELGDIFAAAESSGRPPLIVVCDHITDPQNLGAIIRSAEVAGAHGVIVPKRRGTGGITPSVSKASAGACMHLPIVRCANISAAIEELKSRGVWIFGADGAADRTMYDADLAGAAAIVMGSEGTGLSRLVREGCDFLVSIPMEGKVNSLNVSAAAAVLIYEAVRQRQKPKA